MAYAVIQFGYAIYGVGETKAEATQDANHWLNDEFREFSDYNARQIVAGDICILPCTPALYDAARDRGGLIPFDITDDGIACLPEEMEYLIG